EQKIRARHDVHRWRHGHRDGPGESLMSNIKKVAVIGSGVMGAAIAAHMANAGIPTLLYDVVKDPEDRHQLPREAIEKALKTNPAPFMTKKAAKLVTPANLEDDLDKLKEVDWVI